MSDEPDPTQAGRAEIESHKGQRVRLVKPYSGLKVGAEGTVTWTHPWPKFPYRVKWDDDDGSGLHFGMDDIGWLMAPDEIEFLA